MSKHINELIQKEAHLPVDGYTTALALLLYNIKSHNLRGSRSDHADIITHGLMRSLLQVDREHRTNDECQRRLGCVCAAGAEVCKNNDKNQTNDCYYKSMGKQVNRVITILPYESPCPFQIELADDEHSVQTQHKWCHALFQCFTEDVGMESRNSAFVYLPPVVTMINGTRTSKSSIKLRASGSGSGRKRLLDPAMNTDSRLDGLKHVPDDLKKLVPIRHDYGPDQSQILSCTKLRDLLCQHGQVYISDISYDNESSEHQCMQSVLNELLPENVVAGGLLRHSAPQAHAAGIHSPVSYVFYGNVSNEFGACVGIHGHRHNECWKMSSFHLSFKAPKQCQTENIFSISCQDVQAYAVLAAFRTGVNGTTFKRYSWLQVPSTNMLQEISADCIALYLPEKSEDWNQWRIDVLFDYLCCMHPLCSPLIVTASDNKYVGREDFHIHAESRDEVLRFATQLEFSNLDKRIVELLPKDVRLMQTMKDADAAHGVSIRKSNVCQGLGLFSNHEFRPDEIITDVRVQSFDRSEWECLETKDRQQMFPYAFQGLTGEGVAKLHVPINRARFLNAPSVKKNMYSSANVKIDTDAYSGAPTLIRASCYIRTNVELLFDYNWSFHELYNPTDDKCNAELFGSQLEPEPPSYSQGG